MTRTDQSLHDRALHRQLRWLIGLRWGAGCVVLGLSLLDLLMFQWYPFAEGLVAIGGAILIYNVPLRLLIGGRRRFTSSQLAAVAWLQIGLDLLCLTAIVMWTGGPVSPLLGAFVFHMVFASMLLSRTASYSAALMAVVMVTIGMFLTDQWPDRPGARLNLLSWGLVLVLTVFLTNDITRSLRWHRQRLLRQNRRIRGMSRQLRSQQSAMVQHERMAAMGQMAAGVAHEIANPLANMDSILQLLKRNPDRLSDEKVDQLRDQIDRIRKTIRSMTDFAHPTETQWQPTPINDLVAQALEMVRFDHRQRKVDLRHEPGPGRCAVKVQPHAMQQVLINLLLNALDAVAERENAEVVVRCRCTGGQCMIDVADNGPGIDPAVRDQVFEPFFTTKPVGKGTGLGLSISYRLVENQGGRLEVASEPGEGTTITVVMQRADADQACADHGCGCESSPHPAAES